MRRLGMLLLGVVLLSGCVGDGDREARVDVFSLGVDDDVAVFQLKYTNTGDEELRLRANDGEMVDVVIRDVAGSIVYDSSKVAVDSERIDPVEDVYVSAGEHHEFLKEVPMKFFEIGKYEVEMVLDVDVPKETHTAVIQSFEVTESDLIKANRYVEDSPYADTRVRGVFTFMGVVDSHSIELQTEDNVYLVMSVDDDYRDLYSKVETGLIIEFDYENQDGKAVIVSDYEIAD